MRDAAVQAVVVGRLEKVMLPPINAIRANVGVRAVRLWTSFCAGRR